MKMLSALFCALLLLTACDGTKSNNNDTDAMNDETTADTTTPDTTITDDAATDDPITDDPLPDNART